MKTQSRWAGLVIAVTLAGAFAGGSHAGSVDLPLGESAVISDGAGASRILFKPGAALPAEGSLVSRATLTVPLQGLETGRAVRVLVHPVTRAWDSRAVSWHSGWTRAGGDFDDELFAETAADLSRATAVTLDVTHLVKEIVEEGREAHGFIVTVHPGDGIGFTTEEASRFERIGESTFEIHSRKIGVRTKRGGG